VGRRGRSLLLVSLVMVGHMGRSLPSALLAFRQVVVRSVVMVVVVVSAQSGP